MCRLERGAPPVEGLKRLENPSGCGPAAAAARGAVALRRAGREATGRGLRAAALAMPPRRAHGGVWREWRADSRNRRGRRSNRNGARAGSSSSVGVGRFAAWAKPDGKRASGPYVAGDLA